MNLEDPIEEQRRYRVELIVFGAIVALAVVALVGTLAVRSGSDGGTTPPPPTATEVATTAPGLPRLAGPTELRSGPASNVAIVTRLAASDAIRIIGRTQAGDWLAVTLEGRPEVAGWVRAEDVLDVDVANLLIVDGSQSGLPSGPAPTFTPDLPDLVIRAAFAAGNLLHVEVFNQGAGDASGELRLSMNGGEPVPLDVKGVPLHPGQAVAVLVPDTYVQLRAEIALLLLPDDALVEEDDQNNGWSGIVEPDQANDVEVVGARAADDGSHLIVTVRNNSPIPITGPFTVSVREALPSTTLLGRHSEMRTIGAGESLDLPFPEVADPDLTRLTISISTTAIADANLQNDAYPR